MKSKLKFFLIVAAFLSLLALKFLVFSAEHTQSSFVKLI